MKKLTEEELNSVPIGIEYYVKYINGQIIGDGFFIEEPTPSQDDIKMLVDVASRIYARDRETHIDTAIKEAKGLIQACKEALA
jgi:hypothetical protein